MSDWYIYMAIGSILIFKEFFQIFLKSLFRILLTFKKMEINWQINDGIFYLSLIDT